MSTLALVALWARNSWFWADLWDWLEKPCWLLPTSPAVLLPPHIRNPQTLSTSSTDKARPGLKQLIWLTVSVHVSVTQGRSWSKKGRSWSREWSSTADEHASRHLLRNGAAHGAQALPHQLSVKKFPHRYALGQSDGDMQ